MVNLIPAIGREPIVFGLDASKYISDRISDYLGNEAIKGKIEEMRFPDKEPFDHPGQNIRGRDVYVIQSLYTLENEEECMEQKFFKLGLMGHACHFAFAGRVTAVIPYLALSRKDRKDGSREPISAKWMADILQASKYDGFIMMDVHNNTEQGFYDVPTDFLNPFKGFVEFLYRKQGLGDYKKISLIGADDGAEKQRAKPLMAKILDYGVHTEGDIVRNHVNKERQDGANIKSNSKQFPGVKGSIAIIPDDETVTASTIKNAAQQMKNVGADQVWSFITHCKMSYEKAKEIQEESLIDKFFISDTIPRPNILKNFDKFQEFSVAPNLAKAIEFVHKEESVSSLF